MSRQKVAIVMGGPSAEHEVSLKTGGAVLEYINAAIYEPIKVLISNDRQWAIQGVKDSCNAVEAMNYLKANNMIVFVALHGSYGEDGTIQALCELYGVSYTGSSVAASLLAMDKISANEIFIGAGLNVPKSLSYSQDENIEKVMRDVKNIMKLPCVIKPSRQGSSVGVHILKSFNDLQATIDNAFMYDQSIVVQEFIDGTELSCGVLHDGNKYSPLLPTELRPIISDSFDYKAKYTEGGTEELTPPPNMSPELIAEIQRIAVECHKALGCKSYTRTDLIVRNDKVYVIETNTLPGLTPASILPRQLDVAGIKFTDFLTQIIAAAQV